MVVVAGGRLGSRRVAIRVEHAGAVLAQHVGDGLADARRRARDKRVAAGEIDLHGSPP